MRCPWMVRIQPTRPRSPTTVDPERPVARQRLPVRLTYLTRPFANTPLEIVTTRAPDVAYIHVVRLDPVGPAVPDPMPVPVALPCLWPSRQEPSPTLDVDLTTLATARLCCGETRIKREGRRDGGRDATEDDDILCRRYWLWTEGRLFPSLRSEGIALVYVRNGQVPDDRFEALVPVSYRRYGTEIVPSGSHPILPGNRLPHTREKAVDRGVRIDGTDQLEEVLRESVESPGAPLIDYSGNQKALIDDLRRRHAIYSKSKRWLIRFLLLRHTTKR